MFAAAITRERINRRNIKLPKTFFESLLIFSAHFYAWQAYLYRKFHDAYFCLKYDFCKSE